MKLDKPYVKHSKASEVDDKIWFLEELEAEILAFAEYMKNQYKKKYNDTAKAHLRRIGKSTQNMRITSALATSTIDDLHTYE